MMYKFYFFILFFFICNSAKSQLDYRILVYDFETIGNELQIEDGKSISTSLRSKLLRPGTSYKIELLERENLSKLMQDFEISERLSSIFDSTTQTQKSQLYLSNYVVLGKVLSSNLYPDYRVSYRVINVETGTYVVSNDLALNSDSYNKVLEQMADEILTNIDRIEVVKRDKKINSLRAFLKSLKDEIELLCVPDSTYNDNSILQLKKFFPLDMKDVDVIGWVRDTTISDFAKSVYVTKNISELYVFTIKGMFYQILSGPDDKGMYNMFADTVKWRDLVGKLDVQGWKGHCEVKINDLRIDMKNLEPTDFAKLIRIARELNE